MREVTRTARGLAGLGLSARRPRRHLGQQLPRVGPAAVRRPPAPGVILVNVNPAYRSHELRYVLQKIAHPRPVPARARIRARTTARSWTTRATATRCLSSTSSGWAKTPGTTCSPPARDYPEHAARAGRRRQHPVHLRHHRLAQRRACSRIATCSTTAWRSALALQAARKTTASARRCRSTTASAR